MKIRKWISNFVTNLTHQYTFRQCYKDMEYKGYAIFCFCNGRRSDKYKKDYCNNCPYYIGKFKDSRGMRSKEGGYYS